MSDTKNTGGPAFPEIGNIGYKSDWESESGMTLRDWFAGQVVVALLAKIEGQASGIEEVGALVSSYSYAIADAMIAERSK